MSCRLIFVRHGQSMGNLNGTFLGWTDLPLSPLGFKQAEKTAQFLSSLNIDKIYSSDLLRAYETSLALSKKRGNEVIKEKRFREIFVGLWENRRFSDLEKEFPITYGVWKSDIGLSYADEGESVADMQKRVIEAVLEIAKSNDGKTVAIFTHATVIRALFCYAKGKPLSEMKNVPWTSNASVSELIFDDNKFEIVSYSIDEFLGDMKTVLPKNC